MAIIGTFTRDEHGFNGTIKTLTLNVKAQIKKVEVSSEKAPDYRITAGSVELGAGWTKTSKEGREYISLKLDDPSFPAPVFANLVEQDSGFGLIWTRS
ncbi:DUF736 domain-containing protein [Acidocella aminolytica]|uniref:DUF736 domain-containing protein n=1 Tax=Acidocella aminolytica 101 = DSM 11237 TaxID=1120923 RepID=A0A0D6PGN5_9PROT|nr:DUF736 domain-containing protein [Acidocella aminolytica]GAN80363.1 hypothetical protein Aam_046_004 [Acidocella aminolytica 101 = DSM 11237]GBQ37388.1 hypothetical protein AA11237_1512 [Acidocella aminolytica 101 = DSM 11237]SHF60594.1 Uncharacterized conserved protein, DUF736 family [Acidocella aminolytica 101 = DSM 11237]